MGKRVVSFKKACEEKSSDANQNNISIKSATENLPLPNLLSPHLLSFYQYSSFFPFVHFIKKTTRSLWWLGVKN
jgi:hypothetical protein